jgi:hypothetical protein
VTSSTLPLPTLAERPGWNFVAFGRIELWWMKSFHGVEVPWAFVPLTTLGASGSETSKAAEPPEPVCQPMPAESKSQ